MVRSASRVLCENDSEDNNPVLGDEAKKGSMAHYMQVVK